MKMFNSAFESKYSNRLLQNSPFPQPQGEFVKKKTTRKIFYIKEQPTVFFNISSPHKKKNTIQTISTSNLITKIR